MFKLIYIFILIVILFWIKWKLQKKYKFKEEFSDVEDTQRKLTAMFSSSVGASPPTFYENLYIINSNIKFDSNLTWNCKNINNNFWFIDKDISNHNRRIEINMNDNGIVIGDYDLYGFHDKIITKYTDNILTFELQRFNNRSEATENRCRFGNNIDDGNNNLSYELSANFASFSNNDNSYNSNINETLSNLSLWHTATGDSIIPKWFNNNRIDCYNEFDGMKVEQEPGVIVNRYSEDDHKWMMECSSSLECSGYILYNSLSVGMIEQPFSGTDLISSTGDTIYMKDTSYHVPN